MSLAGQEPDEYLRSLQAVADQSDYPLDAYLFVLSGLSRPAHVDLPPRHIDGRELCWRLRDLAVEHYGDHARDQLASWNIRTCDDFGAIVYALVGAGLMRKTEGDRQDDFHEVYDFATAFQRPAAQRHQWRLSTLFILTTVAAIAFAGFSKFGFSGAVRAVFAAYIGLIGVACVVEGLRNRARSGLFAVCVGGVFLLLAFLFFQSIVGRPGR